MSTAREIKFVDDDPHKPNPFAACKVFAAISPDGDLITRFADTGFAGWGSAAAGQSAITLNSGKAAIHPDFERRGFVLYEDLCKGRVDGVEASPKHWEIWQRYLTMRANGIEPDPKSKSLAPEHFYHPEVLRRRERAAAGGNVRTMSPDDVARFLGFGGDDELVDFDAELSDLD